MASHGVERRIAGRGPTEPIAVTLHATERSAGRLGGTRTKKVAEPAYIVDLSVSGAGVVYRSIEGLVVRSVVELRHGELTAVAAVRRVVERDDGRVVYGVDFIEMDPAMREFLFGLVERRRPDGLEASWTNAR
jgi:hypothetical protein